MMKSTSTQGSTSGFLMLVAPIFYFAGQFSWYGSLVGPIFSYFCLQLNIKVECLPCSPILDSSLVGLLF